MRIILWTTNRSLDCDNALFTADLAVSDLKRARKQLRRGEWDKHLSSATVAATNFEDAARACRNYVRDCRENEIR